MLRGTVERVRLRGAALEGNPLGDPVEREVLVYLPPGYAASSRRYPVLFVLTGYAATHDSLLNFKPWEPNFLERYELLLAQGCPEAVVVMPDCFTRWGGSQFIDSAATGAYQRYLTDDVLPLVDGRYRTLARRESRAIIGKSSGGFGALRMLLDRPELFAVVGSHAGDCAFELSIRPRFTEVAPVYERHGGVAGFIAKLAAQGAPRGQAEFSAVEMIAMAACYAPVDARNPFAPLPRADFPFDAYTAEVVPEVWKRWLAHDPLELVEKRVDAVRSARLVFLDAGKSDEYGLQFGARMLAKRLVNSGATVHHEEFEGGHMGTGHRYDVSLPRILSAVQPGADRSSL
jgi:S-formylglutathione hydrolase FrmB